MPTLVPTAQSAAKLAMIDLISQYTRPTRDSAALIPMIVGPPGISKTAFLETFAEKMGIKRVLVISCGVIDPNLEFIGVPEILYEKIASSKDSEEKTTYIVLSEITKKGEKILDADEASRLITKWSKPDRLRFFDDMPPYDRGLLVFDDVHFLPPSMQAMLMQLSTGGMRIHTHDIGVDRNVACLLIGNGVGDFANAEDFLAPVIGRLHLIEIDAHNHKKEVCEEYLDWATKKGNVHPSILFYLEKNPNDILTSKRDSIEERETDPFASPRSITNLALSVDSIVQVLKQPTRMKNLFNFDNIDFDFVEDAVKAATRNLENFAAGIVGEKVAKDVAKTINNVYFKNNSEMSPQETLAKLVEESATMLIKERKLIEEIEEDLKTDKMQSATFEEVFEKAGFDAFAGKKDEKAYPAMSRATSYYDTFYLIIKKLVKAQKESKRSDFYALVRGRFQALARFTLFEENPEKLYSSEDVLKRLRASLELPLKILNACESQEFASKLRKTKRAKKSLKKFK